MELIMYHIIHTRNRNLVLKQFKNPSVIQTLQQKLVLMLIIERNYLNNSQQTKNAERASKHSLLMVKDVSVGTSCTN